MKEIAPIIIKALNHILSLNSPQDEFKKNFEEHLKVIKNTFYEKE